MTKKIEAIFLDTGNTLRVVEKNPLFQKKARQDLAALAGTSEDPAAFCKHLEVLYQAYKKWSKESLVEVSERDFWTRWMLPDVPAAKITPLADRLTRLWIEQGGRRVLRPDAAHTVSELHRRGYTLGIIANSISSGEIPEWLEREGLAKYFKTVVLSSRFGKRKPDPAIFIEATRLIGVAPENCAYVGDNPSRDIEGTHRAGFGKVIILLESVTLLKEPPRGSQRPDAVIRECGDLLNIFPPI